MAIMRMCNETEDGAYLNEHWSKIEDRQIWMKRTHEGLVLATGEYNGYDDSDFYALVWNDEKGEPEKIIYATTRGWSYPNGATVDATPDVVQKYEDYRKRIAREATIIRERKREAYVRDTSEACDLSEDEFLNLESSLNIEKFAAAVALLKTRKRNRFKSNFRKSLAEQIWTWVKTPAGDRQYHSPLSYKQWSYIA